MERSDGTKGALPLPGTTTPEPRFREQVREALGLAWDAAILAELKWLTAQDWQLAKNQAAQQRLRVG